MNDSARDSAGDNSNFRFGVDMFGGMIVCVGWWYVRLRLILIMTTSISTSTLTSNSKWMMKLSSQVPEWISY